ncbi:MAG: hypothetical protein J6S67_25955 [Methanobrevibacter sp.]|nr:hypothetical protein [Methanobrevibacter sp.]
MKEALKNHKVFDELFTPMYAIEPMLKYIPGNVRTIWCPCDKEDSKIVKALSACGYFVMATHIDDGIDFLDTEPPKCDMIITNPPFSIKDKIIKRCYDIQKPFALLLPLTALEGERRSKMFNEHGIGIVVLDKRVDYNGKGACWYNTSWFIHSPLTDGRIFFEKINPVDENK